jgi:hypothetical protein
MSKFAKPIPKFGPYRRRSAAPMLCTVLGLVWPHCLPPSLSVGTTGYRASAHADLPVAHAVQMRDWRAHRWEGEAASAEHFNRDGRFVGATTFALSSDEFVQACAAHLLRVQQAAYTEHTPHT